MINLSVCDKIDGLGKIDELRNAIGTDYCGDNQLVSVSKDGDRCTVKRTVIGGHTKLVNEPSWLTWNRMFY
jgi:hypothetical protein